MKEVEIPTIEKIRQKTLPVLKSYGAIRAGVFGSVVHGKARRRSDVDIDIEFHATKLAMGYGPFTSLKLLLPEN